MHEIQIYRGDLPLYKIKPETDSLQTKKVMGENDLKISFVETQHIDFKIGDKCHVFGEWYFINSLPVVTKSSSLEYRYDMTLESTYKILAKTEMLFLGDDNSLKEGDFSLTGKAATFLQLIISNLQRHLPYFDFTIGEVIDTGYKTLIFQANKCLDALAKVAEAFDTEYWIEGTRISLTKIGRDTGYTFKVGRRKGLYELIRQTVDNSNVVTRLYAFGSDKNLPENYRNYSKRLKIPSAGTKTITNITWTKEPFEEGTQAITFNWDQPQITDATGLQVFYQVTGEPGLLGGGITTLTSPHTFILPDGKDYSFMFRTISPSGNEGEKTTPLFPTGTGSAQPAVPFAGEVIFIEKNKDLYGLSEATVFFDDIYPHRTGKVTGVNGSNPFEFTDVNIDFDVNGYLLPGMTAKVTFNSGQLSGYTFEISSFDNLTKKFIILKNKNERAIEVPSTDFKPSIGDEYVITDIKMPGVYIDNAENELLQAAQTLLNTLSEPQLSYRLIFDPVYLKTKKYDIHIGDFIWVVDSALQLQRKFRIISVSRKIVNEYEFQVEIADTLSKSKIQSLVSGQGALNESVSNINKDLQNNSILNNRVVGDLILTGDATLKFDNLQTGTGLVAVGIGTDGKLYKM